VNHRIGTLEHAGIELSLLRIPGMEVPIPLCSGTPKGPYLMSSGGEEVGEGRSYETAASGQYYGEGVASIPMVEGEVVGEAGVTKGEEPLELTIQKSLGEEPAGRTQRRCPFDLILHEAPPVIGGDEPMEVDPLLERTLDLFVLKQASLLVIGVPDLPLQLRGALSNCEEYGTAVMNPPFPLQHPHLNPGWDHSLESVRPPVPGEDFFR
jgi:hypothetical protein